MVLMQSTKAVEHDVCISLSRLQVQMRVHQLYSSQVRLPTYRKLIDLPGAVEALS